MLVPWQRTRKGSKYWSGYVHGYIYRLSVAGYIYWWCWVCVVITGKDLLLNCWFTLRPVKQMVVFYKLKVLLLYSPKVGEWWNGGFKTWTVHCWTRTAHSLEPALGTPYSPKKRPCLRTATILSRASSRIDKERQYVYPSECSAPEPEDVANRLLIEYSFHISRNGAGI